ncbi:MAG: Lipoyl(Octanoyl) transferase [Pseudomonadota bacterium]|nr:Lipoyl(Octanoyl) transferase [Pseudomonadota bacterium]
MHREVTVSASTSQTSPFVIRQLGLVDYESIFAAMQAFTAARQPDTPD